MKKEFRIKVIVSLLVAESLESDKEMSIVLGSWVLSSPRLVAVVNGLGFLSRTMQITDRRGRHSSNCPAINPPTILYLVGPERAVGIPRRGSQ
jgi:hypothetical protein